MDVQKKLDEIVRAVSGARSLPMSASCVVNRADLLALLEEVRAALPASLAEAQEVLGGREQVVEEAHREAERIIESAHAQRGSLVSDTEVARRSREEADRILDEARREAAEIRAEADDYVDSKLANFEVVLTKTIGSVDRGRDKLLGRAPAADGYDDGNGSEAGHAAGADDDGPERSADPETLRHRADAYVDAKLGAVAAVLAKTLEAVGRGRQKLHGARAIDELAAHMAAQEAAGQDGSALDHRTSDADYLADLARTQAPAAGPLIPAQQAAEPGYYDQTAQTAQPAAAAGAAGYPEQGGYGYQGQDYPQGYPAHDPYAAQDGYRQPDGYGWQQPYEPAHDGGYGPAEHGQAAAQQPPYQQGAALDETSLFDTSMIDLDQLRQYEQGGR
ncbi:cell division initiation protein [Streptomyces sp. B1866]|uniref:DivIVA domain-containing protein n=1 Tax=Streptomyces sp. B1866 TaxID=3075431 RepID=UPI002891E53A|nr:cell division initiation protein [Streptomyces sp. B1866]MDT3399764.1 cell division initiation protein [Streptomyces sp. B1866]MDT3399771.1 cell division initiation protein [Streptomyces sp. B1866]